MLVDLRNFLNGDRFSLAVGSENRSTYTAPCKVNAIGLDTACEVTPSQPVLFDRGIER